MHEGALTLEGLCYPSLTCRHWVPFEPPIGSVALQVGVPSSCCAD